MVSRKIEFMALELLLITLAFNACAQWSPGEMMVYLGDLNLAGSPGSIGAATYPVVGSPLINLPMNNSSMGISSINNSTMNSASVLVPLDLSRYASNRANKNLAGYTNIMYPLAESRGSTASTAGGGGCGCG
jgi:hypothetical protein